MIFVTLASNSQERWCARLLVRSLRAFGGDFSSCPVWVYDLNDNLDAWKGMEGQGLQAFHLEMPKSIRGYLFADKVSASAEAERSAGLDDTLVWLNPECLVLRPPSRFELDLHTDLAVRPVHVRNVGLLASQPLDPFWQAIYNAAGLDDATATVEFFVDGQRLRAYYNCCAYAVNPRAGLLRRWLGLFERMVTDSGFQAGPCAGQQHQIFLHQAVQSALIAKTIPSERIRLLPPEYSYPVHLHHQTPAHKKAAALDDTVVPMIDAFSNSDLSMNGMTIRPALKEWLEDQVREIS